MMIYNSQPTLLSETILLPSLRLQDLYFPKYLLLHVGDVLVQLLPELKSKLVLAAGKDTKSKQASVG
jgi:hypothetical protein